MKQRSCEEKTVSFTVEKSSLSFFYDKKHNWIVENGEFEVLVGVASIDKKVPAAFILKKNVLSNSLRNDTHLQS